MLASFLMLASTCFFFPSGICFSSRHIWKKVFILEHLSPSCTYYTHTHRLHFLQQWEHKAVQVALSNIPPAASEPYGWPQIKRVCRLRLPRPVDYQPTEWAQCTMNVWVCSCGKGRGTDEVCFLNLMSTCSRPGLTSACKNTNIFLWLDLLVCPN